MVRRLRSIQMVGRVDELSRLLEVPDRARARELTQVLGYLDQLKIGRQELEIEHGPTAVTTPSTTDLSIRTRVIPPGIRR